MESGAERMLVKSELILFEQTPEQLHLAAGHLAGKEL